MKDDSSLSLTAGVSLSWILNKMGFFRIPFALHSSSYLAETFVVDLIIKVRGLHKIGRVIYEVIVCIYV